MTSDAGPIWVAQLELGVPFGLESVCDRAQLECRQARVLVRLHGDPMGFVELPEPREGLTAEDVRKVAWEQLGVALRAHLDADGISYSSMLPSELLGPRTTCRRTSERGWRHPISVVVCTRDRPELLRGCLESLARLRYPKFEVLVIDNAPSDDATRRCFVETAGDDARFRYEREMRPGLSHARNRGLAGSAWSHVAFTDDDVLVDPRWLDGIAQGFARRADVSCVTGLVPSACLDNAAQQYFDRRVSWSAALNAQVYAMESADASTPLFPFDAGSFGTGANFAVDRDVVARIGGFDAALGAGTRSRGSEDLDMFVRVLRAGGALAREPSAIVWHRHRAGVRDLRRQMSDFGVALGAYLTKQLTDRETRHDLLRRVPGGAMHMLGLWRRAGARQRGDLDLILAELWGVARGPFAYRGARRAAVYEQTSV